MPVRDEPFVIDDIYHVFNKTIDKRKIFQSPAYCELFIELLRYYRSTRSILSHSKLKSIPQEIREKILSDVNHKNTFKVNIFAYCLMPTHFHLLLKQRIEKGIPSYMSIVLNSFTRFFNIRTERKGPLFLPKFFLIARIMVVLPPHGPPVIAITFIILPSRSVFIFIQFSNYYLASHSLTSKQYLVIKIVKNYK